MKAPEGMAAYMAAAASRPSSATSMLGVAPPQRAMQHPGLGAAAPTAQRAAAALSATGPGVVFTGKATSPTRSGFDGRPIPREVSSSLASSMRMSSRPKPAVPPHQQLDSSRRSSGKEMTMRPPESTAQVAAAAEAAAAAVASTSPPPPPPPQAAPPPPPQGAQAAAAAKEAAAAAAKAAQAPERPAGSDTSDTLAATKQPGLPPAGGQEPPQQLPAQALAAASTAAQRQPPGIRSPRAGQPSQAAAAAEAEVPLAAMARRRTGEEASSTGSRLGGVVEQPDLPRSEELRRRIQLFEKGSKPSSGHSGQKPKGQFAPPSLANASTTANSAAVSTAGTRTSSPVPHSPTESNDTPNQLGFKERQVVELRAQIARCERHLYAGGHPAAGAAAVAEPPQPDPERTGPRSPKPSSLAPNGSSPQLGPAALGPAPAPLEEELAWIVRQMEVHRTQIQLHQQQLSTLEKRHAEIVAGISAPCASRQAQSFARSPSPSVAEPRTDLQGLMGLGSNMGGCNSPGTGSVAGSVAGSMATEARQLDGRLDSPASSAAAGPAWPNSPSEPPPMPPTRSLAGSVRSLASGGLGGSLPGGGLEDAGSDSSYAQALAAAEARLGLRGRSRPTSAGSGRSPYYPKAGRPGSACSTISDRGGLDSLSSSFVLDEDQRLGLHAAAASARAGRISGASDFSTQFSQGRGNGGVTAQGSTASLAGEGPPPSETQEGHQIAALLDQLATRRTLRVPFQPLDGPAEGRGRPYLHGSLEVRLLLSDDGSRLLVRVGAGGRLMDIEDFVTRAEAIELRRGGQRPIPIAEEAELPAGTASPRPAELAEAERAGKPVGTLRSLLNSGGQDLSSARSLPWKNLFKAHWDSR